MNCSPRRVFPSSGLLLLGSLGATGLATAQAPIPAREDTTKRLPEIEVRAVKPLLTVGGASGLRLRPDSLPLPTAATLEQTLRKIPLLHIRRNSRGEAEISVRGSDSRQVAVLVDGIPITLAWDARADISAIPATGVQEVTFVRGLSSMLYGPNVLGGVVELGVAQTSSHPSRRSAELATGVDHVGGFGSKGSVTIPSARWLIRAGGSHRDSPGVPLARNVAEAVPTADGLRLNTDTRHTDGFAALRYQGAGGGWLAFSGSTFTAKRGIAAELGYDDARFWRYPHISRSVAVLSGGTGDHATPLGGRGDLEASVGLDLGRTEIDAYTSRAYTDLDGFENGKDRTVTFRMLGDHTIGSRGDFRAAFTAADIRHDEFLPGGEARYRQRLLSVGGESVWRVLENRGKINAIRLSVGGAYDVGQTPESGGRTPQQPTLSEWGGRVGVTMVAADGRLLAHGGVSRRGRFPALRELYSGALNRFAPNPELKPEKLVAIEGGLTVRLGENSEIQAVGFRHQMRDAVVRIVLPDLRFMRVNRNRLTSTGIELLASTVLGGVVLQGDLTAQSVRLTNTAAGSSSRPENLPQTAGGITARVGLPLGLRAGTEVRYTGGQFCIDPATGNDAELAASTILSGDVSREWALRRSGGGWLSRLEASLGVENIGNAAAYGQCRLPEPGRLARIQVRLF